MTNWENIADGAYMARLPGLRLVVCRSHNRFACTQRWGWIIGAEAAGASLAKSRLTRHSSAALAMAGALRHVRQYMPVVWQAAMASDG